VLYFKILPSVEAFRESHNTITFVVVFYKGIKRDMMIFDEIRKEFLAIDVFAISLKYLVEDMMGSVNKRLVGELEHTDVSWVLTVPAIWSDASKQFMREAAIKVCILM
jgi:hypothetical protein